MTVSGGVALRVETESVEATVRAVLDGLGILANALALDPDRDLFDAGMTSHASVRFMLALEDAFDLEFPDDMLKRETFSTIAVISAAVRQVLGND